MTPAIRLLALVAAIAGGAGILIQLQVQVDKEGSLAAGIWQLARYYTYWTNTVVFLVMAATVIAPHGRFPGPRVWLMVTSSIVLVGTIYYTLIYNPSADLPPIQQLAEHLLHGVVPTATLLIFLIRPHGLLRWQDIWWGIAPVLVYGVYLLARGALDGTYPYWFTDVPKLGLVGSIKSGVMLVATFSLVSLVFIVLDKVLALVLRRTQARN